MGALNTFEAYEVKVEAVAMDDRGLVPDRAPSGASPSCRPPAATSSSSTRSPTSTIPPASRWRPNGGRRSCGSASESNILIIEDNPYGLLRFDGEPIPPLRAGNPDDVIYMGSFSKILAPGLRIGWALVPAHLQRRFYLASEAVTLCPPTLNQMLVREYLDGHDWRGQITTYRDLYAERCLAMLSALKEFMPPGAIWTRPEGGFFVWVTLPEGIDTYPLLHRAIDAGVVFIPGAAFSAVGRAVQPAQAGLQRRAQATDPRGRPPAGPGHRRGHRGGRGAAA